MGQGPKAGLRAGHQPGEDGGGHPAPRGTAQSLRAEKAFNAPLMALFSSAAFLAFSIGPTGWPTSKDSIMESRIDWSLQFYLHSLRAFDGQDELCRRASFLGEEGRGTRFASHHLPRGDEDPATSLEKTPW